MTRRQLPPGLRLRGSSWTWEVRHQRLRSGRMVISLRTDEITTALERMNAAKTLMDRGDWKLVERLRSGDVHITDVVRSVREGEVSKLRRSGHDLLLLGDVVESFLRTVRATKAKRTYRGYDVIAQQLVERFSADFPVEQMTKEEAERYLHEPKRRQNGKVHPWSARRQRFAATVAGALWQSAIAAEQERATQQGYTPTFTRNVWRAAETPEIRKARVQFLSPGEWRTLARKVEGRPEAALMGLLFLAGLRIREAMYLRPGVDVLIEGDEPVVRIQARDGEHPWDPKTERSQRDVPVGEELLAILERHVRDGYAGDRYLIRLPGQDQPLSYRTATEWTRRSFEAAGIKYGRKKDGLTSHSGRHSFASWLAQRGVPLNVVADLLGDTMQVAYDTYAHLIPDTLREAVMVIDQAVREDPESTTGAPT